MQVVIAAVGKPGRLLDAPIREYEERAARYWKLAATAVKAESASRNRPVAEVRRSEAVRLRDAVDPASEVVALTRGGESWSSDRLATYLNDRAIHATGDVAFLIGGAFGLDEDLIRDARHRLSVSPMTLPHDLARLVLAEQLYRAGTIIRGEPYHKG